MRFFSIALLCILCSLGFATPPANALDRERIIVGGDHENPPYEFIKDGRATGFNIELMREVANAIGIDVEFRLAPWGEVRRQLENGKIDALAGMYYSEGRSRLVDFSVFHTMVSPGLFVRKGSPIHSMEDIAGREVIVQKGDAIDDYLREKGITSRIVAVKDPADELRLLASGQHDCALMPSRVQGEYLKNALGLTNIRAFATDIPQLRYCFAVRKGNSSLRYRLDEGLNILQANGRYQKIYDKWFGVYEKRSLWQTVRYLAWALALFAGLLAASTIWSWSLRREVKKRTDELRAKEESLRFTQFAIDNAADQAFWMTEGGHLDYVNDAACRALGYSREELLQLSIPDIDPIFQPERFAEHWRDLQENGCATFETLHRAKDGRVYPVEIRANYVVFDGKEYNCAFATDISERKRSEEALRESEEKFRVLKETSPAAICLIQGERHIYVNNALKELSGYSDRDFQGLTFWDCVHADYRELVKERGLARQRGEQVPSPYEIKSVTKSGEEKWVLLSAGRIEYRGAPAVIATLIDITDRKRMEFELQHAYDDLEKLVQERTTELKRSNELLEEEISVRNRTERVVMARLRLLEFASDHSLDQLLEATVNEAEELTGSSYGFFHFVDSDQLALYQHTWSTRAKEEFSAGGHDPDGDIPLGGAWQDCIHERGPVIKNYSVQTTASQGLSPGNGSLNKELALPVFRGDSIVAVLGVGNKPHDYTMEDIEAVSFLADLAWEIAERKQAEEDLHLSQFCIDKAGIGIFQTDEKGTIFSANEHACNSLGYALEELCALTVFDIDPEVTPEKMMEIKETLDESGLITHYTSHRRKDGTTFPVEITTSVLDFHGKTFSVSFVKDLTERRRTEETLRQANMVVENSPVVLFRCKASPGWPVELVSKNVIQFGYTPDEFLSGKITYSSIVYKPDLEQLAAETEEFSAAGKELWFQEYRIVTKQGDLRWIIDETICVRDTAGNITHYEGVIIDVTERKLAEENLQLQKKLLEELNRTLEERVRDEVAKNREKDIMLIQQNRQAALGEILDHVAHQWKQPLNAISLIAFLLKDDRALTMDKVNETVDKILGQVDHMSQTLNDFRDFYRPDKEKSVFRVKDAVDRAVAFAMPALQFESVKVDVHADPDLRVTGYPKEFAQVIINLVTNSRDAFRERKTCNPRLAIECRADGDRVIVTVADNGGGIAVNEISRIFSMNFTTKDASGGTGVGLYMSKNIIEKRMGGSLTAANSADGARFTIVLSVASAPEITSA